MEGAWAEGELKWRSMEELGFGLNADQALMDSLRAKVRRGGTTTNKRSTILYGTCSSSLQTVYSACTAKLYTQYFVFSNWTHGHYLAVEYFHAKHDAYVDSITCFYTTNSARSCCRRHSSLLTAYTHNGEHVLNSESY